MNKMVVALIVSLLLLSACGSMKNGVGHQLILEDHVLSDKIWDVRKDQFIDKEDFLSGILKGDYVLLGETHDNRLHHEYQSWIISELRKSGVSALVAFEMISNAQGEIIKNKQYSSSNDLVNDLNQIKTTWKYEQRYQAVFDSILKAGYEIRAANLDRNTIMGIARKGENSIPSRLVPYLEKNVLTDEQKTALRNEIKMSHCGMENPHMTNAMMLTQQVKDAAMADSLMRDNRVDTRVLVAGSGHVRKDRGVPRFIRGEQNDARIVAIAWLEVVDELMDARQYAERWGDGPMPFDYIWFTARTDRPDPCKSFRQHMEMKNRAKDTNN